MDEKQMLGIVERYSRQSDSQENEIKVTRVPDWKTVFVEQFGEMSRSIVMTEYKVDGKTYWAGYSSRSQTVFVSQQNNRPRNFQSLVENHEALRLPGLSLSV
jgi:hypothetical protein